MNKNRVYVLQYEIILPNKIETRVVTFTQEERNDFIKLYRELQDKWYISGLKANYADCVPIPHDLMMIDPF